MSEQCTCIKDPEITCIAHPHISREHRVAKRRIAELEAENKMLREAARAVLEDRMDWHKALTLKAALKEVE